MIGRTPHTKLGRLFEPPPMLSVEEELEQGLAEEAREHGVQREALSSFLDFALATPTPKRPLDLDRYAFQRELYSALMETAREAIIEKGAQIGVSEVCVRLGIRWTTRRLNVLYLMPRERQATEFSDMRVKPVIAASGYLRGLQEQGGTSTKRLKSLAGGNLAIRGSTSEAELISFDGDAVIMDEYDRLEQRHLPLVEQRVTGAMSRGLLRRVSTPIRPGRGIHPEFLRTDQRRWWVRCGGRDRRGRTGEGCGEWNEMAGSPTLAANVEIVEEAGEVVSATLVCKACRRPLDPRQGEYVASHPERDVLGYHLPKFVVPGVDLVAVVKRSRSTKATDLREHHNQDLGEPWQPEQAGLTEAAILASVRPFRMNGQGYTGPHPVTMGVDVAASRALNVRISEHYAEGRKRMLWCGLVDDGLAPWGAEPGRDAMSILQMVLERFRVTQAAIDHMPDPRLATAFAHRNIGRVWRVSYAANQRVPLATTRRDPTRVSVRPLEAIDAALDGIRQATNELAADRPDDYDRHLQNRALDEEEDEETGERSQAWVKDGDDDYLQAEVYDVIATHMMLVTHAAGAASAVNGVVRPARDAMDSVQPDEIPDFDQGGAMPGDDEPMGGWGN